MSANKVQRDLSENHGRHLTRDFIQNLAQDVGSIVADKEHLWTYTLPPQAVEAQIVSIGRDGTTMHIRGQGYRETMNGTVSFHDALGNRVHTIYLAHAPQYGKADFNARFEREIQRIKILADKAVFLGLADGAKDNWTFLDSLVEKSILDFWHASQYLTLASKAASKSAYERKQWLEQARHDLRHQQNGAKNILKQMKKFRRKQKLSKVAKQSLEKAITYFTNHHHQMDYVNHAKVNYPIGSGVTEAACKVIVKERLCQSGMKWNIDGAQKTLCIRALYHSDGHWSQFWDYVDKYEIHPN